MINITLRLSESLLSILRDAGIPGEETIRLQVKKGTSIRDVLHRQGINPLLVPMISIDNVRTDRHALLETDATITLIGPLAGG